MHDILNNARLIRQSVVDQALSDYQTNIQLRHQIEREFTIIGEAVARLNRTDLEVAAEITSASAIVSFRNTIVHDYEALTDEVVWDIIQKHLPVLVREVEALLSDRD